MQHNISSHSTPITAADFPEIGWRASWIWCDPPAPGGFPPAGGAHSAPLQEAHALFRKTFTLAQVPGRVPARITADSRYLLYCNGREVYRGPIRSQPQRTFYDLFDLAPYLRAGENVLAIYVKFYGRPKAFWMPASYGHGELHGPQMVFEADLGGQWLVTDASWKVHKSTAWDEDWRTGAQLFFMEDLIPTEVFDARQFPHGWQQPGFDDSAWASASPVPAFRLGGAPNANPPTDPYGPLYPRPIAQLGGDLLAPVAAALQLLAGQVDTSVHDPVRRLGASLDLPPLGEARPAPLPLTLNLEAGQSARVTLDMGRIVMGQPQFTVQAPAGAAFDFSFTEETLALREVVFGPRFPGSRARYYARGADDTFRLYDALGFRYVNLLVHGVAGPVTLNDFAVQEDIYPWQAGAEFHTSDEELNRIFQAGIRTVNLNARDAFTDCPTREQQAWVGDSVVHQMITLVTNTDWRLAWQYLTLSDSPRGEGILPMTVVGPNEADGGQNIPDWSLHWVHGVYNLYRFGGDRELVLQFMPSVARVLRWFAPFQNRQGVLEHITGWTLIDWSAVSVDGQSSIYTAIWARGLREFAEMAGWLGENASKAWAEELYEKARAGFEIFWNAERGSYIDHIVGGEARPEMSQLAGALGIVSGLAPRERWQQIIDTITDPARLLIRSVQMSRRAGPWDPQRQIIRAEPFMSYVVHDAVAAAGLADRLTTIYRDWSQFLRDGYDTIGEDWQHGTHVHGWSCTPTKDMVFYTLGVTPAEPGYAAARVAPALGGLAWAEGKIPTPHGLIAVRAEPDCLTVDSPVPLVVELPGKPPHRLPAGKYEIR